MGVQCLLHCRHDALGITPAGQNDRNTLSPRFVRNSVRQCMADVCCQHDYSAAASYDRQIERGRTVFGHKHGLRHALPQTRRQRL